MNGPERLRRIVEEFEPDSSVFETETEIAVIRQNGLSTTSPDKSDDNIQWMIDLISRAPGFGQSNNQE